MREYTDESLRKALDGEIIAPGEPVRLRPAGPDLESDGEGAQADPRDEARVRARFFKTLKKAARQIPFMDELVAAYYCALDPASPPRVRGTLIAALAYFVLPFDAVPDFLLGIGFGDDATVLLAAIGLVRAHIRDEHLEAARATLADDDDPLA
ncbi:YkvA family protein [Breoghania sp. L-A4]|uniref:YkvA family protein n=1 Tax=Breoghania sp. L-A4 TaxID=2304600 RepID=UPI000E360699|nr:YkvA family protein [Breoghania sp. L-A4]AXS42267.1 DUF1232 domain-containing protein [Breoghania sp. L-A4]